MARAGTKRLIAQARRALAGGNRSYALMLLREAHDGAPKDGAAAVLLARLLLVQDHPMAAIEMLAAHLALNPRSAEAARKLSDILASVTPVTFSRVDAACLD
ncbi:MAG: tetratricopeptide repeat protein, partial [Rhodospirillaceae bacterium]|nr:tetratricopeptide repeat protein [Rhodospirillaceae bacterium]